MKHTCHWPGCGKSVPPAMWGCRLHWFTLPKRLRDRILATYRPGQEVDKRPSENYMDAAQAVQYWIAEQYPGGLNALQRGRSMGVKRFDYVRESADGLGWMEEASLGQYILSCDYDAVAAELQRVYETNASNAELLRMEQERAKKLEATLSSVNATMRAIIKRNQGDDKCDRDAIRHTVEVINAALVSPLKTTCEHKWHITLPKLWQTCSKCGVLRNEVETTEPRP